MLYSVPYLLHELYNESAEASDGATLTFDENAPKKARTDSSDASASASAPSALVAGLPQAAQEAAIYLSDAFGSAMRIDYGTGHELNFILFLICLRKSRVVDGDAESLAALALHVFAEYLEAMRKVQRIYWLEPAGSKGAWGLDDYQFLCFLWGTAQLAPFSALPPSSILNATTVAKERSRFLFFSAIDFVCTVKTGPFSEHSAMLYQISTLPSWRKANAGLLRMYTDEVLMKYPIVQHICFGTILKFQKNEAKNAMPPPRFAGARAPPKIAAGAAPPVVSDAATNTNAPAAAVSDNANGVSSSADAPAASASVSGESGAASSRS
jgi:serine/threonine-protein phosphatase 2A activator